MAKVNSSVELLFKTLYFNTKQNYVRKAQEYKNSLKTYAF